MRTKQSTLTASCFLTLSQVLLFAPQSLADVAPPVEIKMALDTREARSGAVYAGAFEVRVFRAGTLADFELVGDGWNITTVELPAATLNVQPGVVRIPFTAIPTDADRPIGLSLTWNGRRVRQAYEIGPAYFSRAGTSHLSVRVPGSKPTVAEEMGLRSADDADAGTQRRAGGRQQLQFVGRIAYSRPGRDFSNPPDGDYDDPGDIPPAIVGLDSIDVQVWDNDPVGHETIWSGLTDENGYFSTPVIDWDDGGDDPDLILHYETEVGGVVDVTDNSLEEWTYTFETSEIEDFTGSFHDFGTQWPADHGLHPALHIFNSVVRTRRYILETPTYVTPEVQVEWPDNSNDGGAWYEPGPVEIHISTELQWRNDTVSHEYGHHFVHSFYSSDPPEPDYCNEICDDDYPDDCGHCVWCEENDHDAWHEGFANWTADIVTRSYPSRYTHQPSGEPFVPLYTRSQERLGSCDGVVHNRWITEGYIGALLRDIDDETQDDHDDDPDPNVESYDSIFDMLCVGAVPIFRVVYLDQPNTVAEFISAFRTRYPEYTGDFWPTAYNVGGPGYVSGFPVDTQPPGAVLYCNSSTHPLGEGGSTPCIKLEWWPAPDDASGASAYSYVVTTDPNGVEPDEVPVEVWGGENCTIIGWVAAWDLGQYYVSIKACDSAGNWSSEWSTFGPFEVVDCNGTGVLDACDINCWVDLPYLCAAPPDRCLNEPGCGSSEDCQLNNIPDECDIASGRSEDCNLDSTPDECQEMYHWAGTSGSWHFAGNWAEGTAPLEYCHVCIDVPGDQTVSYDSGSLYTYTLGCRENLEIAGGELIISRPSWVDGTLTLNGSSATLAPLYSRFDINGPFEWRNSARLRSDDVADGGVTYANGGLQAEGIVSLEDHHLVLDGYSTSVGTARIEFVGDSTFEIRQGSSYEHQGGTYFLNGSSSGDYVINAGTLMKSGDTGDSQIRAYTDNSGLIHVQTGSLTLWYGGTCNGHYLGDPGTLLEFHHGYYFDGSSSIVADRVSFPEGGHTIQGTYDVTTSTTTGSWTVTFTDQADILNFGSSFHITFGTVNFDCPGTLQFDTLNISDGDGKAYFNTGNPVEITDLIIGKGLIQGPSDITISGSLTWNRGGEFRDAGAITTNGDVLVGPNGDRKLLDDTTFNNAATATFLGGVECSGSAVFNNLATGVVDLQADVQAISTVNNAGLIVKSAGTGTSQFRGVVTNAGTIEVQTGTLRFYTGYGGSFTQTAGQLVLDGGDLEVSGTASQPLRLEGGALTGAGTIIGNVFNSGGTVAPGLSIGEIGISGWYAQGSEATLEIELAGVVPGEYDTVVCTGNATLAGELAVTFVDPFEPLHGDTFVILTTGGTLNAAWDDVIVTNLPQYMILEVDYSGNAATITVFGGDCDSSGVLDLDDFGTLESCLQGPAGGLNPGCECIDLDGDGDGDLEDFALFQLHFGG